MSRSELKVDSPSFTPSASPVFEYLYQIHIIVHKFIIILLVSLKLFQSVTANFDRKRKSPLAAPILHFLLSKNKSRRQYTLGSPTRVGFSDKSERECYNQRINDPSYI